METTRILWSGLTGRTGREAIKQAPIIPGVEIVAGMKRHVSETDSVRLGDEIFKQVDWFDYATGMQGIYGLIRMTERAGINIIVDFSHPDVFDRVLELAIRTGKPLVSGTSGLSARQMASLYDATNRIPVFRGGNFRFKVKQFIDEALRLTMMADGTPTLYENFYEGKSLPSETSKVIRRRISEATGKKVTVYSEANLPKENLPCKWRLDLGTELRNGLNCNTVGFDKLAHDVLDIARVMAKKPVKKGEFYDLDEIWDDLVSWVI